MDALANRCTNMSVTTVVVNIQADDELQIIAYEKLGFEKDDRTRNNVVQMKRHLGLPGNNTKFLTVRLANIQKRNGRTLIFPSNDEETIEEQLMNVESTMFHELCQFDNNTSIGGM